MKRVALSAVLMSMAIAAALLAAAEEDKRGEKKITMSLMRFYEGDRGDSRYIIVLDRHIGFGSVGAFKRYLSRTKRGYTLTWDPGCDVDASMPLRDKQSLQDFKGFCSTNDINFVIIPSG